MKIKVDYRNFSEELSIELDVAEISCEMSLDYDLTQSFAIAKVFTKHTGLPPRCIIRVHELESPKGDFVVNEYSSGFEVEHIESGKTHWLSDGVDVLTYFHDDEEVTLNPGTFGFKELWTESLNEDSGTTYEAYFPELESDE